ncbi:MAG: MtrAB system accessory lipoprotein LpqB [Corynebacterium sp.]|uniref:MtrAB system accessory lipoprotein LpqB n=1 Tax=Corynebacterium sp. TaxID=1720 RepID=UPI0026DB7449|nr:MtrAB system accessory lipoprotein LpqB [Corynebacterium sp.]MDO5097594.1 MtrAB system accessory lipoprotein LpqB [Corynebacterium sp.]
MKSQQIAPKIKRTVTGVALIASISTVAACASLPSSSEPQALRSVEAASPTTDLGPIPGREPDLLLRDFYAVSASPSQQYQQARSFLSDNIKQEWSPGPEIVVLDRIDMSSNPSTDANSVSYTVTGTVVGTIAEGGAYNPSNDEYRATVTLSKADGEWRVSDLPNQVVVERTELRNRYTPKNLYFFDPSGTTLVSDRRWIYSGNKSLDSALISLLLADPSAVLRPGVLNEFPETTAFTGMEDGVYKFTGGSTMDETQRRRLAAQLVWTLALADISGPYRFEMDDEPLVGESGNTQLTVEDFPEFNPQAPGASSGTLYALTGGKVSRFSGGNAKQLSGFLGTTGNIESLDVSATLDVAAAVVATGERENKRSQFHIGPIEGQITKLLEATTLSKPTFEGNTQAVWTVVDGTTVLRVARSASTGEIAQTEVDTTELGEQHGDISVLRLSATGVRAAFIIDGRVYTATVTRPTAGERKLTNVRELVPVVGDSAITLEWALDDSLLVGTASADTPVWRADVDGSSAIALSSGNIVAPVVSVAANGSTIFITDARAALQLGTAGSTDYWREVPGLEGSRSVTIVPR